MAPDTTGGAFIPTPEQLARLRVLVEGADMPPVVSPTNERSNNMDEITVKEVYDALYKSKDIDLVDLERKLEEYEGKFKRARTQESKDNHAESIMRYKRAIRKTKRATVEMTQWDETIWKVMTQRVQSVKALTLSDGGYNALEIITNDVIIPYRFDGCDMKHYNFGQFKVRVYVTPRIELTFSSYAHNRYDGGDRMHPHLNEGTSGTGACLGSYGAMFETAHKTCDLPLIIATLVDYLNSVYGGDWFSDIRNFMTDDELDEVGQTSPEDWCGECDSEDCWCDERCEGCNAHHDDCECICCPAIDERLNTPHFPARECMTCELCVRNEDALDSRGESNNPRFECRPEGIEFTDQIEYWTAVRSADRYVTGLPDPTYMTQRQGVITNAGGVVVANVPFRTPAPRTEEQTVTARQPRGFDPVDF